MEEHAGLIPFTPPEIADADLAPLALELAAAGVYAVDELEWLDPPPPSAMARARELLAWLGALDATGRITPHGARTAAGPRRGCAKAITAAKWCILNTPLLVRGMNCHRPIRQFTRRWRG